MSSRLEARASVSETVSQIRIRRRTLWPQADRWPETETESSRAHMELCLAYGRHTSASMCVAPNLQPGWIPPVCCESLNSHSVPQSKHSPGTFHSPTLTIPTPHAPPLPCYFCTNVPVQADRLLFPPVSCSESKKGLVQSPWKQYFPPLLEQTANAFSLMTPFQMIYEKIGQNMRSTFQP